LIKSGTDQIGEIKSEIKSGTDGKYPNQKVSEQTQVNRYHVTLFRPGL